MPINLVPSSARHLVMLILLSLVITLFILTRSWPPRGNPPLPPASASITEGKPHSPVAIDYLPVPTGSHAPAPYNHHKANTKVKSKTMSPPTKNYRPTGFVPPHIHQQISKSSVVSATGRKAAAETLEWDQHRAARSFYQPQPQSQAQGQGKTQDGKTKKQQHDGSDTGSNGSSGKGLKAWARRQFGQVMGRHRGTSVQ